MDNNNNDYYKYETQHYETPECVDLVIMKNIKVLQIYLNYLITISNNLNQIYL